ncbi:peptidoglycan DD-metalloendopeptidase family protein [Gammaproteobacteria bacterium AH-315-K14]|nr:peptidoglycan DD-metalloendopeptidase family protein [Gammaproteobacteria bacterium AH-315-K14]MBN4052975.1 peptidoglycan DD-metalloendopeptidase family protein [Gammaproteobacteria bacterium AH-315-K14]
MAKTAVLNHDMFFIKLDKLRILHCFWLCLLVTMLLIGGCGGHVYHRVEKGETLYSIGWIYGYDYRQIASWNDIAAPYELNPGQHLRVVPPSGNTTASLQDNRNSTRSVEKKTPVRVVKKNPAPVVEAVKKTTRVVDKSSDASNASGRGNSDQNYSARTVIAAAKTAINKVFKPQVTPQQSGPLKWHWPVKQRRILRTFLAKDPSRQGLDFAGGLGSAIVASASGRVVYAGSGLVRYGQLIIVKHNEKFLSAYAHNRKLHVKEGEWVNAGQRIADMGKTGNVSFIVGNNSQARLHFEIRRNGKPINPVKYLPK